MYDYIKGEVAELNPAYVVIEAGGVGYHISVSLNTYSALERQKAAKVYVHYIVREDAQLFYGFSSREERELFRYLIGVSGVGGNTARMILSTYSPKELVNIIASENSTLLKNVKGLGLKTAQKIIVELKDKITGVAVPASDGKPAAPIAGTGYEEAVAALMMLGFSRAASDKAIRGVMTDDPDLPVEELVRRSLKKM